MTRSGAREPDAGRYLNPDREAAILDATLELLTEAGYDRISIDQIARRAGASKATIYRRWAGKAQLVADVICQRLDTSTPALPDAGSLRGDLLAICRSYCGTVEQKSTVLLGLIPALVSDPTLARSLREHTPGPGLALVATALGRATARGDLPRRVRPAELLTLIEAVTWHRLLSTGKPLERRFVTSTVDRVLLPFLGASPDAR